VGTTVERRPSTLIMEDRPTLEDYREKHDDYKTVIDGNRYVMTLVPGKGTCLVPIQEDYPVN